VKVLAGIDSGTDSLENVLSSDHHCKPVPCATAGVVQFPRWVDDWDGFILDLSSFRGACRTGEGVNKARHVCGCGIQRA
jgi:hypothetical protein